MIGTEPLAPVYTAMLFPPLNAELVTLLRGLGPDDWMRPTVAGSWRVREVVGHLLDGDLRKLSGGRDRHRLPSGPITSFDGLVELIDGLNAGGVRYTERMSPRLMTELLEVTGQWVAGYVAQLAPHEESRVAVAWAAEERSENWMDIGREYTERWHHQMQIREAVGVPGLMETVWFQPVMDLSVRAFRRAYRDVPAEAGTGVVFDIGGEGQAAWSVVHVGSGWEVMRGRIAAPAACVRSDPQSAWRLLFNALSPSAVRAHFAVSGDPALADPMLRARAVMVKSPGRP